MGRKPPVEVEGLRNLRRTIKAAGMSLDDLKAAHKQVADTVVHRAAERAPRKTGKLAGTLRGSGTAGAAIVRAGGARTPYAGPIHWGWPRRHIKAQPFIYNAAGELHDPIARMYLAALQDIIADIEGVPTL